jgi:Tol biopolymer transport system component
MIDDHDLFERAVQRFAPPQGSFERLVSRRDRTRRNKRIAAGVLALVVAAAGTGVLLRSLPTGSVPATPPVDLGIFEPVAGRIVYYGDGGLWGIDPNGTSPAAALVRLDLGADADRFTSFTVPLGWSRDGTELLFVREDPTDDTFPYDRHLFILHADGTETQVTPEPVSGATISPDGSRVIFAADDGGLYVIDAEGGQPVRIADEGESPTFSPDGAQVAYLSESGEAGDEHVWVANADGTDAHEILTDEALAMGMSELTWSPTGDRIAMENQQEGLVAIYTFTPDGTDFTEVITGGFNHSWSPDGSQFAFGMPGLDGVSIADADGSNVRTFGYGAPGPWHPGTPEEGAEATMSRSPSSSPQPSPPTPPSSSSPGSSTFTSTTNGISIMHPIGWQVRLATEPWDGDAFTFDAPGVDVIFDPARQDGLYLSVASAPLAGRPPGNWCCGDLWLGNAVCETGGNFGRITVDGAAATIRGCDGDANRFQDHVVQVATATRGYVIHLHVADDPTLQATYDEAWFDALLETVELQ